MRAGRTVGVAGGVSVAGDAGAGRGALAESRGYDRCTVSFGRHREIFGGRGKRLGPGETSRWPARTLVGRC